MNTLLKEKSAAPDFSAVTYDGQTIALTGLIAGGPAVLSFLRSLS